MLAKTKGIVLKNTNYRESSIISKMYTREFGLRTYILQSIKKGKSIIKPSMVQPLSIVEMDVYEKPNAGINRLKELKNTPLLLNLQDDIVKKSVAMFYIEVLNKCVMEEHYETELFDFIEQEIINLNDKPVYSYQPIDFLLKLTPFLGVQPQGKYSDNTPYFNFEEGVFANQSGNSPVSKEVSKLISLILNKANLNEVDVKSANLRKQCLNVVLDYYQIHVIKNREIKSIEILSELLH